MSSGYIVFKEGRTRIPVREEAISFFKGAGNYIFVYCTNGTCRKQCGNLKEWEENPDVADSALLRVHSSYLINWKNVSSYDHRCAIMNDVSKTLVPLSDDGYKKLEQKFSEKNFLPQSAPQLIPLFIPPWRVQRNDEEE